MRLATPPTSLAATLMQFNGLFNCATVASTCPNSPRRSVSGYLVRATCGSHTALHAMLRHTVAQLSSCGDRGQLLPPSLACHQLPGIVYSSVRLFVCLSVCSVVRLYVRPSLRFANWPHFSFLSLCLQFRFDSVLWHGHFLYNPAAIISAKLQHQQQQQQQQSATAEPELVVCVLFTSFTLTLSAAFELPSAICNKGSKFKIWYKYFMFPLRRCTTISFYEEICWIESNKK